MFGVIEAGKESNINYPQTQDTLRIRVLKANHILPFSDLRASTTLYETIGDAVMAVFHRPEQAVKAALDIQRYIENFNASMDYKIVIKVGIHTGPAIAVNSNERLDYFGRTVNLAARIQNESRGNDIVISEQCFERKGVQEVIKQYSASEEVYKTHLKGIAESVVITRIWL